MRKLFLTLGLCFGLATAAHAQTPCIGVGGVNNINVPGVTCAQEAAVSSYSATSVGLAPASSATDIACIGGASNIVARVKQIRISGTAGTLISLPITILKRAAADSGGTLATGNALPVPYALDASNIAAKATTVAYTGNPSINDSSPGIIDAAIGIFNVTTTAANGATTFNFDFDETQTPLLRSSAQQLCVNLNATTISTGLLNVNFRWTEAAQ